MYMYMTIQVYMYIHTGLYTYIIKHVLYMYMYMYHAGVQFCIYASSQRWVLIKFVLLSSVFCVFCCLHTHL